MIPPRSTQSFVGFGPNARRSSRPSSTCTSRSDSRWARPRRSSPPTPPIAPGPRRTSRSTTPCSERSRRRPSRIHHEEDRSASALNKELTLGWFGEPTQGAEGETERGIGRLLDQGNGHSGARGRTLWVPPVEPWARRCRSCSVRRSRQHSFSFAGGLRRSSVCQALCRVSPARFARRPSSRALGHKDRARERAEGRGGRRLHTQGNSRTCRGATKDQVSRRNAKLCGRAVRRRDRGIDCVLPR